MPDFKALLENMNREFEEALPLVIQNTSPETLYAGLRRLDKSTDQMVIDLSAFLEKYPYIMREKITIGFHLRKQLDQLGINLNKGFAAGIAWDKRIGHQKEFRELTNSLKKKTDKVKLLLKEADERANE
ncbi:MAG: hypothetical protein ACOY5B_04695 [Spirochaetota bacterium]